MTKEEQQKLLDAIGKSGIFIAGDMVFEKNVENEIGNVEPGGIGLQINYAEPQPNKKGLKDMPPEEEPLKNFIFNTSYFNSNAKLVKLRNTIAAAIDMGDATIMYGKPQETRINPTVKNEWYYIVKAIVESGVSKPKTSDNDFVEQMVEWFPMLFPDETPEEFKSFKRKLAKSVSAERSLWRQGSMNQEVVLKDIWAKGMSKVLGIAKAEKVFKIAYKGLYINLTELKQEIEREKSGAR